MRGWNSDMNFKMRINYLLINRVPGIRTKYNNYRKRNQGIKRLKAWCYLGALNFRYYVMRDHNIGEDELYPDKGKKIITGSETEVMQRVSVEEICSKLERYDVISFDIFDTLILRKMNRPEDVFYLVQKEMQYINLKSIRMDAEWRARQKRYKEHGDYEVTLAEIWNMLHALTTIDSLEGARVEIACEESVCYANPYFIEIVKILKEKGKRIILCSDMYLESEYILRLLENAGFPKFDDCFISCEYRKSKANGELFEIVKNKYGEKCRYIHLGDNEFSDVKMARKHGFDAIYYQNVQDIGDRYRAKDMSDIVSSIYSGIVNGFLHNGASHWDPLYEFGYLYGGLFVVGYCQFIHNYVKNNAIDKVLFLSRDGDILLKAYEKMYPDEREYIEYAYWSRLAGTKLCAHRFKAFYLERMVYHKVNQGYSLKRIFETMEIYPLLKEFLVSFHGAISEESILESSILDELIVFINTNWSRITEVYQEQSIEGKNYYSNLLHETKKVAVVDVGWVGSGAITLKQLIENDWNLNCKIFGLVAGSCSGTGIDCDTTAIEYAEGDIVSYLFSAASNRDVWKVHDASKGHNMIVELLLSSSNKSFRGFIKDSKGEYQFNNSIEKIDANLVQKGVLDFVDQFMQHPLCNINISGRDAMAPILLLYQNEQYIDSILRKSEIKANIE